MDPSFSQHQRKAASSDRLPEVQEPLLEQAATTGSEEESALVKGGRSVRRLTMKCSCDPTIQRDVQCAIHGVGKGVVAAAKDALVLCRAAANALETALASGTTPQDHTRRFGHALRAVLGQSVTCNDPLVVLAVEAISDAMSKDPELWKQAVATKVST